MGKHYVPQYYLQGFSDRSNDSMIRMYEKEIDKIRFVPIENIANEKNPWPQNTEDIITYELKIPRTMLLIRYAKDSLYH